MPVILSVLSPVKAAVETLRPMPVLEGVLRVYRWRGWARNSSVEKEKAMLLSSLCRQSTLRSWVGCQRRRGGITRRFLGKTEPLYRRFEGRFSCNSGEL